MLFFYAGEHIRGKMIWLFT